MSMVNDIIIDLACLYNVMFYSVLQWPQIEHGRDRLRELAF